MSQELSEKEKNKNAKMERQVAGIERSWMPQGRRILGILPSDPRCTLCLTPFEGVGGAFARVVLDRRPSNYNPLVCNYCE